MRSLLLTMTANISVMSIFGLLLSRLLIWVRWKHEWQRDVFNVIAAMLLSVLVSQFPLVTGTGGRYDLRSVPVLLTGIAGGPVLGLCTGILVALYRYSLGGPLVIYGMVAIVTAGLTAGAFSRLITGGRMESFPVWRVIIPGFVSNSLNIWFQYMTMPADVFRSNLFTLLPVTLVFQPVALVILTLVFQSELRVYAQQKQLQAQLQQDIKTQLLNSGAFDCMLADWLKQPDCQPVSVLFLDLDLFKQVNDKFGHDMGDAVLKELSQRLLRVVRPTDKVARYGGEEFTISLSCCDFGSSLSIAERIRLIVSQTPFCRELLPEGIPLTVSIGVATNNDDSVGTLIKKADRAMYAAKRAGRNRVLGYSAILESAN